MYSYILKIIQKRIVVYLFSLSHVLILRDNNTVIFEYIIIVLNIFLNKYFIV